MLTAQDILHLSHEQLFYILVSSLSDLNVYRSKNTDIAQTAKPSIAIHVVYANDRNVAHIGTLKTGCDFTALEKGTLSKLVCQHFGPHVSKANYKPSESREIKLCVTQNFEKMIQTNDRTTGQMNSGSLTNTPRIKKPSFECS